MTIINRTPRSGTLLAWNIKRGTIALALALLLVGSFLNPGNAGIQPSAMVSAAPAVTNTPNPLPTFTLGSYRYWLLGPTWHVDTVFHTVNAAPGFIGYVSNTMTWGYTTESAKFYPIARTYPGAKAREGNFDGCSSGGAWLNSTYTDPSNPTFVRGCVPMPRTAATPRATASR